VKVLLRHLSYLNLRISSILTDFKTFEYGMEVRDLGQLPRNMESESKGGAMP
jgi:hypothetical protein